METNEKFCPVCKNKNDRAAVNCKYCGAILASHPWDATATTVNTEALEKGTMNISGMPINEALIPQGGIGIYVAGASKPVYLHVEKAIVFGRQTENLFDDSLLDLSGFGGYQMGISRRHAVIRRSENGFELIDLGSTNGSWLNDERLLPQKPYPMANLSQVRLGRMRILILFHAPDTGKDKS